MNAARRVSFARAVLLLGVVALGALAPKREVSGEGRGAADPVVRATMAGRRRTHA